MAGKRTRRRFTAEFKAQAVRRVLEGGKPLSEVATELGLSTGQLSTGQLSTWRTEHLAAGSAEVGVTGRFVQNCTLSRISALPCRVVGPSAGRQRHLSAKRWHRALPSRPGRIRAHTPLPHPHRQP